LEQVSGGAVLRTSSCGGCACPLIQADGLNVTAIARARAALALIDWVEQGHGPY
jgi:hypothetical protein